MKRLSLMITISLLAILLLSQNTRAQTHYYITGKDGTKLYVQEFGQGSPVVLLAGGPGLNPIYLKPLWEHLEQSHRCIVLNQRGTGKSIMPVIDSSHLTMADYVNDLEALRKHLGLQKLVLTGHSWGGMLAMLYLSREPEHVRKVVLIDPGGLRKSSGKVMEANINERLTADDVAKVKKANSYPLYTYAMWPGFFYHRDRALDTRSMAMRIVGPYRLTKLAISNYYDNSAAMISSLLKRATDVSVILIKGKEDPEGKSTAMEIKKVLPQTQIELIDHCGHIPWLENPTQVREFYELLQKALYSNLTGLEDRQQVGGFMSLLRKADLQ